MRIACLHVPAFPLAVWYRTDPELRGRCVAVTDGRGSRSRIVAVSPEAQGRAVSVGATAVQAAAVCADLVLRPVSSEAERAAQAALCDVADSCSPRVEDTSAGLVYLDCTGLGSLHESEQKLADSLRARAAQVGLDARVGIGSSKIMARMAAYGADEVAVIRREEEWRFLGPLPIDMLEPDAALRKTLGRWGIHRLADLAALPASAVATRLGPEGAILARRARGEDDHPLISRPAPVQFEETAELDHDIETVEAFGFVARALLDRLTMRLQLRGLLCGDLRLSLRLSNRGRDERTVSVAAPGNDTKALLALVRLSLEARPPAAPVETIRIAAVPERLRLAQLDLFRPAGPTPQNLSLALARLTALCGAERVGSPAEIDSHRPDAYRVVPFAPRPADSFPLERSAQPAAAKHLTATLRAIRPPHPLEVFTDRGEPDFVRLASDPPHPTLDPNRYACTGRVVSSAGPWRIRAEWWSSDPVHRDYYDVQLSDGVIYRLFYDRRQRTWFVDGVYD